jgi:integrase/recombinase XerD
MPQARVISDKQAKTIFTVIQQGKNPTRNALVFALSYYAGMRAKEISSLNVSTFLTDDGKVREVIYLNASMTKGKRGREVFLNSSVRHHLKKYIKELPTQRCDVLIRPMGTHNRFSANSLSIMLNNIYKRAGFDGCSSHSGRRSYATSLCQKGVSVRVIQRLGGWSSIASVMPYLDANEEMLKEAVELVS